MKPRTLRVFCLGCDRNELDIYLDEDFGEAFACRKCGTGCLINFDKNTIEIDTRRSDEPKIL